MIKIIFSILCLSSSSALAVSIQDLLDEGAWEQTWQSYSTDGQDVDLSRLHKGILADYVNRGVDLTPYKNEVQEISLIRDARRAQYGLATDKDFVRMFLLYHITNYDAALAAERCKRNPGPCPGSSFGEATTYYRQAYKILSVNLESKYSVFKKPSLATVKEELFDIHCKVYGGDRRQVQGCLITNKKQKQTFIETWNPFLPPEHIGLNPVHVQLYDIDWQATEVYNEYFCRCLVGDLKEKGNRLHQNAERCMVVNLATDSNRPEINLNKRPICYTFNNNLLAQAANRVVNPGGDFDVKWSALENCQNDKETAVAFPKPFAVMIHPLNTKYINSQTCKVDVDKFRRDMSDVIAEKTKIKVDRIPAARSPKSKK